MNLIPVLIPIGLFVAFVFWLFRKKMKKYDEKQSKLSAQEKESEDSKFANIMTVIIPGAILITLKQYGWSVAIWSSVVAFIIGRVIIAIDKKKKD